MAEKKIIVVFGATGAQGGGLVRAILNDPEKAFAVRAVTRDPESDKSKALSQAGAELVKADVDDASGIEKALEGAYGAYFVTFFWDHFSPEKEMDQVEKMAKAAKAAGLKHVIWSTLEDTRNWVSLENDLMPTLQEKYKVPHFDGKGASDRFFKEQGVPTTYMYASYYWENMIYFGMGPKRGDDGKLSITFPMGDKKMAGIAAEDIGKCAYGIFKKGEELVGKKIGVAGEQISLANMAKQLGDSLGEEVIYNEVSPAQYRSFGFPGAEDLGNMFQFYRDFDDVCNQTRDVSYSRELNPELQRFEQWVSANLSKLAVS
jgi:uncharacterized protein YbjT (DUF2867 family)